MNATTTSEMGLEFIIKLHGATKYATRHENTELVIGCKHVLKPSERRFHSICISDREIMWRNGLTDGDVKALLRDDLFNVESDMRKGIKPSLQQHEWDALASFIFDIGRLNWLNSLVRFYLNEGHREYTLKNWSYWHDDNSKNLREAEIKLFTLRRYT